ncbi:hypothetical protein CBR_g21021 [Chara braunii]|uniref:HAT C-terminal dimerisation domain-containing protein n=1 Tax=Chara braunii TaxID=69332 RepID=A0A388L0E2_CHABU|nr:hypothetical protein CBR_g21021 [Chara braunii]|eukprot:GBG75777.1 hypothetical protein CBR_g21021 [Chara braunii]
MECKLCGRGFQGSQSKATQHFTVKNNCSKVTVEQLVEIWNKTNYSFDHSHHRKILDFLRSRGFRANRNTSGREQAGEEEYDDSEDERRAAEGGGGDSGGESQDMEMRREAKRARDIGASLDGGLMAAGRRGQEGAAKAMKEAAQSKRRKRKATTPAPSLPKKGKVLRQTSMMEAFDPAWQREFSNEFLQWWYVSEIPFEAARRPEYQRVRKRLLECPPYTHPALPTHRVISSDDIPEQQRVVVEMVAAVRKDIAATGATILTDGRKSITSDQIVRYAPFWEHMEDIVELMTPVMQLLRRLDRGGCVMTRMWSWALAMVDRVARARLNMTSMEELHIVVQACQARVNHMLEPAPCMTHLLNPRHRSITYFGAARRTQHDKTLADESLRYLRQQTGADEDLYQTLRTQFAEFLSREGEWMYEGVKGDRDAASCKGEKETSQVGQWWVQHGDGVPLLRSYAICLTHTWTCASPSKRNWAVHEHVQVKKRNQLGFIELARLVEISTNLRLSRCQGRGSGYVLPWEDPEEETKDSIPPPRDEGVRPADRVTEAQRDRQVQRGRKDRLSKASPIVETYFGRRATVLMPTELDAVYDPELDPMAQNPIKAEPWSDPDDLAVESEPGDSDDGGDDDRLDQLLHPRTRASTAAAAQHPPPPPPPGSSGRASTGAVAQHPSPPIDRLGHGEQGTRQTVEEGRGDDDDNDREGYEGSSEDEDDLAYSPTRGRGDDDDDDDEGGDGTQVAGGLQRPGRQRADRCSGAGRGGSGADKGGSGAGRGVVGARDTGAAGHGGGGQARRESASSTCIVHWVDEGAPTTEVGAGSGKLGAMSAEAAAEAAPSIAEVVDEAAQVGSASAQLGASFSGMLDVSLGFPPTPADEHGSGDADTAATPVSQVLRDIPSCSMGDINSSMLQEAATGTQGSLGQEECAPGDGRDCRSEHERAP